MLRGISVAAGLGAAAIFYVGGPAMTAGSDPDPTAVPSESISLSPTPTAIPSASPSASPSESISLGPAPLIGEAVQARRTVTRTCRTVTVRYSERTGDGPWVVVDVERRPTGRDCAVRVPTKVAGGR